MHLKEVCISIFSVFIVSTAASPAGESRSLEARSQQHQIGLVRSIDSVPTVPDLTPRHTPDRAVSQKRNTLFFPSEENETVLSKRGDAADHRNQAELHQGEAHDHSEMALLHSDLGNHNLANLHAAAAKAHINAAEAHIHAIGADPHGNHQELDAAAQHKTEVAQAATHRATH